MTLDLKAVEALSELEKAALEGPWFCNSLLNGSWRLDDPAEDAPIATMHQGFDEQRRNGQFLAALRNAAPELLALAKIGLKAIEWVDAARVSRNWTEPDQVGFQSKVAQKLVGTYRARAGRLRAALEKIYRYRSDKPDWNMVMAIAGDEINPIEMALAADSATPSKQEDYRICKSCGTVVDRDTGEQGGES